MKFIYVLYGFACNIGRVFSVVLYFICLRQLSNSMYTYMSMHVCIPIICVRVLYKTQVYIHVRYTRDEMTIVNLGNFMRVTAKCFIHWGRDDVVRGT